MEVNTNFRQKISSLNEIKKFWLPFEYIFLDKILK